MKDILPSASHLIEWVKELKVSTVVILDNCDDVLEYHLQDDLFELIRKLHNASNLVKTISTSRVHFTPTGVTHARSIRCSGCGQLHRSLAAQV